MNGAALPSADEVAAKSDELDAIRRRVINVIGHELRTPVTTIHGLAEQVCGATDLAAVTDEVGPALLRSTQRLTSLLDDLLVASGIETAIPVGRPQTVDVAALVREVWTARTDQPLDLEVLDIDEPEGAAASGDPSAQVIRPVLRRALEAVVDNAVAYSTGPSSIAVGRSGGSVVIAVDSPAPALHPEEVRLAVEPFFRGERAVTSRPGLGLGLAIARELAGHLGGSLRFEATASGTITTLSVPL